MSVVADHDISNTLLLFLLSLKGLPPQRDWRFMLRLHLSACLTNCAELHDLVLCSAEIDVEFWTIDHGNKKSFLIFLSYIEDPTHLFYITVILKCF